MGLLRPDKEHPQRFLFNYAHRFLGISLLVLSSNFNKYERMGLWSSNDE